MQNNTSQANALDLGSNSGTGHEMLLSAKKFRALVENNDALIALVDENLNSFYRSSSAARITGWTHAEFEKIAAADYIHPEDIELVHTILAEALANPGKTIPLTSRFLHKDGYWLWLEGTVTNMLHDPDIQGIITNMRDVTERKKAEEELTKMHREKEMLLNRINDGMISVDNDWRFTFINDAALAGSPLGRAGTLGQVIWDIHPEIQETIFADKYRQAKETGKVVEIEGFYPPLQSWFSTKIYPSPDGLTIFYTDITERLKTHDDIIKERNLSDSIINSLPGIFYLYTKDGKFLRWNKNFETVTKYTGEEIKQMNPLDFFARAEKVLIARKINNTFSIGEENVQAGLLLKTKEKIPYYFTGKAIEYEGKPCLLGVGIDFTDRVMAQEKIKESTEQLRMLTTHLQNVREEERKRIGREIHDELGQQLTAIKMDVAWLDRKMPEEEIVFKDKLKNIISMLDSSNNAIRRILSELRPGILDDYGLLEAIDWLGTQFTANTSIPLKFTTNENKIQAAEAVVTCIFRVYQEALTNITRYAGATKVATSLTIDDGIITVSIEDNGKGFTPASVQTHKSFGILGMKERVISLGGIFEMNSSAQHGTTIMVKLPVTIKGKN